MKSYQIPKDIHDLNMKSTWLELENVEKYYIFIAKTITFGTLNVHVAYDILSYLDYPKSEW